MTTPTPRMSTPTPRVHLSEAEAADLTRRAEEAERQLAALDGTDWTPATLLRAYREMSQAHEDGQREVGRLTATRDRVVAAADALEVDGMHEAAQRIRTALNPDAHPRAVPITSAERASLLDGALARATRERDEARADLARAQELIAELRDVAERADRAFARYDTGGGETPPDPGSVPRAQGVAADRPEIAVDGTTGVAGTSGKGADLNGAQNATQAAGVWEDRSPRCAHCGCPRTHHDRADGGCNGDFLTCTCRAYVPVVRVED